MGRSQGGDGKPWGQGAGSPGGQAQGRPEEGLGPWTLLRSRLSSVKMAAHLVTLRPGPSSTLGSLPLGSRRPTAVWAIGDEGALAQEASRPLRALEGGPIDTICKSRTELGRGRKATVWLPERQ